MDRLDRARGALLGVALGDALGLPAEGMSARAVQRRFGEMQRFHLLGRTGFVSDDTELTALIAHSLTHLPDGVDAVERRFRRHLAGWFLRLPFGIGLSTLKASLLVMLGVKRSGRPSAGNGAAMRAAPLGIAVHDPETRRLLGERLARVTHTDLRAVGAALVVAELTAVCMAVETNADREALVRSAMAVLPEESLLRDTMETALRQAGDDEDAHDIPNTGYAVHSLHAAVYFFLRFGSEPLRALQQCIRNGGDTDSIAAILGSWCGALCGERGLPRALVEKIQDGPFGPSHLRALANALVDGEPEPRYSWPAAMARNLLLYPVILGHGFRRLAPW